MTQCLKVIGETMQYHYSNLIYYYIQKQTE